MDSIEYHRKLKGKIGVQPKAKLDNKEDLSAAYTPGVADVCKEISNDVSKVYDYTMKSNSVAVVTDGSAVLGLGDIGPEAALPVMEGKALIFKQFANVDAYPICLNTRDVDEIVSIVKNISPGFGGINLEDISAPRCFEILEKLQGIGIPVFHDDQHGSAIAMMAGMINALKVVGKDFSDVKIVVSGAGAAGNAVAEILSCTSYKKCVPVKELLIVDSKGIISKNRDLIGNKKKISEISNPNSIDGNLKDAMEGADVFIGVSKGNLVSKEMISSMNKDSIVFAMANPIPEIMPTDAKDAGAKIVATGRSDFGNQINNSIVFPGFFRGLLDSGHKEIKSEMMIAVSHAIASLIEPTENKIVPDMFDDRLVDVVARAVE